VEEGDKPLEITAAAAAEEVHQALANLAQAVAALEELAVLVAVAVLLAVQPMALRVAVEAPLATVAQLMEVMVELVLTAEEVAVAEEEVVLNKDKEEAHLAALTAATTLQALLRQQTQVAVVAGQAAVLDLLVAQAVQATLKLFIGHKENKSWLILQN